MVSLEQDFQGMASDPAESVGPGNLLEMQMITSLSKSTASETPGWAPVLCVVKSPAGNSDAC